MKILPEEIKEHPILLLDGHKALNHMGLKHTKSLQKSMADTVEFYQATIEGKDLLLLAHQQMDKFFKQDEH